MLSISFSTVLERLISKKLLKCASLFGSFRFFSYLCIVFETIDIETLGKVQRLKQNLKLIAISALLIRYRVAVDNSLKTTFWKIPEENYPQG